MNRLKELVDRFDTPGKPGEKLSASEFHEVRDGVLELIKKNKKSEKYIKRFRKLFLELAIYEDTKECLKSGKEYIDDQLQMDMKETTKDAHLFMNKIIKILLDTIKYGS